MRFAGGVTGAAPLQLQLKVATDRAARITVIYASGESDTGSASRISMSRPSIIGVGSTLITPSGVDISSAISASELASSFSSAPSVPPVSVHSSNLPMRFSWQAPPTQGFYIVNGAAGLLYGAASGGHSWSCSLEWEEL